MGRLLLIDKEGKATDFTDKVVTAARHGDRLEFIDEDIIVEDGKMKNLLKLRGSKRLQVRQIGVNSAVIIKTGKPIPKDAPT